MENISLLKEFAKFNNITYYDEPHIYFIEDMRVISVTGLLKLYESPFDHDKNIVNSVKQLMVKNPELSERNAYQIVAGKWVYDNKHACYEGSLIHSYMENKLANKVFPDDKSGIIYHEKRGIENTVFTGEVKYSDVEITVALMKKQVDMFFKDYILSEKLIPIRSELIIGNKQLEIAGMIDQLFFNTETNTIQLWDWKTNTKFNRHSEYDHYFKYVLSEYDVCQLTEYSLQTHMYKYILENSSNIKLDKDCFVVWFNEKNEFYEIIKCLDVSKEIPKIFAFKKENPDLFKLEHIERPKELDVKFEKPVLESLKNYDYFSI